HHRRQWGAVSSTLLLAAEKNPQQIIPILLPFFTKLRRENNPFEIDEAAAEGPVIEPEANFDKDLAQRLFDIPRLHEILCKHQPSDDLDEDTRLCWVEAQRGVADLVGSGTPSENDPGAIGDDTDTD
ncbi:MAG: hypothetical protein AAFO89_11020, partial [Planctomycetota bacterium]